jgi:hypothetical protein
MKRGLAFALFVPLSLITVARSQTAGYSFVSADKGPTSFPAASCHADVLIAAPPLQPDTVRLANQVLRDKSGFTSTSSENNGGLWVSGDVIDALARLRWIVGPENTDLLELGSDNRVTLNAANLVVAAKVDEAASGDAPLLLATYISKNEGLLLLLQITESTRRYRLHIGQRTPTSDGDRVNISVMNLDNNFDSRINPYRKNGVKLRNERPPEGFDSLAAINPTTRWLNLRTNLLVPPGSMTFHELAEAYAKVELGFDYLGQGSCRGAHDIAIEREEKLMTQRPCSNMVITKGENLILRAEGMPSDPKLERNRR